MEGKQDVFFILVLNEYFESTKKKKDKNKRKRKTWVKPWLMNRARESAFKGIFSELALRDKEEFRKYLRMNTNSYEVSGLNWAFMRVLH